MAKAGWEVRFPSGQSFQTWSQCMFEAVRHDDDGSRFGKKTSLGTFVTAEEAYVALKASDAVYGYIVKVATGKMNIWKRRNPPK